MAKSRAEIQKAYRERRKEKDNEGYLKKERERRQRSYIPAARLPKRQLQKRNEKNRGYLKTHREKKQLAALLLQNDVQREDASEYDSGLASSSSQHSPLVVNMPFQFPRRRNGPRRRISRALARANRKIVHLDKLCHTLKRKYKTVQRRMQRHKRAKTCTDSPRSRTNQQMRNASLSPDQCKKIRRHLLLGNVLMDEIKSGKEQVSISKRNVLHRIISGKIVKKYRCIRDISKATGLSRNRLGAVKSKSVICDKFIKFREIRKFKDLVIEFLERDDNSRAMPGKSDSTKMAGGSRISTRVLTDYLSNLHQKFLAENSDVKISLASFCRIRPNYIKKTAFISRSTCLCTRHQNMALVLKSLKRLNISVPTNPESFISEVADVTCVIDQIEANEVSIGQWKRIPIEEKGKKKMVMRIIDETLTKDDFCNKLLAQYEDFKAHVSRMRTQYAQILQLKERMPPNDILIHMDFAENYNCKSVEEIQSAYWNQTSVTLHPAVMYYRTDEEQQLLHKSFVIISDEMGHNSTTVLTFLKYLNDEAKLLKPNLNCIHYWTDSPTSQYRNKIIFDTVLHHEEIYGMKAKWNYFEAGHGKGPCDGLGGTTKRMADEAVRCGKVIIQCATDFMSWAQKSSMTRVKFVYVPSTECQSTGTEIANKSFKIVKGTMQIHAVCSYRGKLLKRDVSCYCDVCLLQSSDVCDSWCDADDTSGHRELAKHVVKEHVRDEADYSVDDFVAADYGDRWYVGKITEVDDEDKDVQVSFLENKKNMFQWPSRPDVIWVKYECIICKVSAPLPSGKSKRMLVISQKERDEIEKNRA